MKTQLQELENYLHEHIPLSKAMEIRVAAFDGKSLKLWAPIQPNINHRETVFGGSASSVAILAAWSLLYLRLKAEKKKARIVIQRNNMEYEKPILSDFEAVACLLEEANWLKFKKTLERKGVGRIAIESTLFGSEELEGKKQRVGYLTGVFVAQKQ